MRFRPYSLFFLLSIGVLIEGYLTIKEAKSAIDIQLYDTTYFEEAITQFYGGLAFVLFGLWCIYALTDRYIFPLHNGISWLHVVLSLGSVVVFLFWIFGDPIEPNTESSTPFFDAYQKQAERTSIVALIFLIGQLMFPINIFRSVILRARNRSLEE